MTNEQMQNVTNAAIAKRAGVPGAREVYNTLWDTFRADPDFDAALEAAENGETWDDE